MIHYGDITKLSGYELPVVDVITGGSPCQDLSVAGKRAGLAGERSGLFMEQMRIVKEMREHDRLSGRTGFLVRPRYMVWENVPGAFSSGSPKGADFAAVIEEIIKVAEPGAAVCVRVPDGGWTKSGCYYADDGSWSIAWRVHDAQFWGVPQRRKRISLVADFGGLSAPEILFERQGLRRDSKTGGAQGEGTAAGAEEGAGGAISFKSAAFMGGQGAKAGSIAYSRELSPSIKSVPSGGNTIPDVLSFHIEQQAGSVGAMNPWDPQSARVYPGDGVWHSLNANENGGQSRDAVLAFAQNQRDEVRNLGDKAGALAAEPGMKQQTYVVDTYPIEGNGARPSHQGPGFGSANDPSFTLNSIEKHGVAKCTVYENHSQDSRYKPLGDVSETVNAKYGSGGNNQPLVVFDKEMYNAGEKMTGEMQARYDTVAPTVRADSHPSGICTSVVRRLTPMECERLQGYPDGWTDIGNWTDSKGKKRKAADGPRYKALGNSIALPFWQFLARRICAQYERDITLGSLFDGIGGFPYVFERCGAKAVWASEIEEFAIAVTKKRFPEEDEG